MVSVWKVDEGRRAFSIHDGEVFVICHEQVRVPPYSLWGNDLLIYTSMLADTLLLYRCYVVWNRNKRVLIVPAILFVLTTLCGYGLGVLSPARLVLLSRIYISLTFALNVILTTMIGMHHVSCQGWNFTYLNFSKSDMVDVATGRQEFSSRTLSPIRYYLDDIVRFPILHSFRSNIVKSIGLNRDLFTQFICFLISHSILIQLKTWVLSSSK